MAKLALIFIAVFFFFQFVYSAEIREKRDVEATTPSIFDNLLSGIQSSIQSTFSEQNIKKAVDNLNEFGEKVKDVGTQVVENFQNALKKDDATPAP